MGSGIVRQRNVGDRRLPRLLDGAHAGGRAIGVADHAAAAQIHQVDGTAGAPERFGRLPAPLAGAGDGQRAVGRREDRRRHRLEGFHEGLVGLPVLGADAVDLELVDAEQAPELLPDLEVHAEARDGG